MARNGAYFLLKETESAIKGIANTILFSMYKFNPKSVQLFVHETSCVSNINSEENYLAPTI